MRFAAPMVLTNSDFRFIVTEQLQAVGIDPGAILIEPEGTQYRTCGSGRCPARGSA